MTKSDTQLTATARTYIMYYDAVALHIHIWQMQHINMLLTSRGIFRPADRRQTTPKDGHSHA